MYRDYSGNGMVPLSGKYIFKATKNKKKSDIKQFLICFSISQPLIFFNLVVCQVDMKPDCNENVVRSRHIP